MIALSRRLLFVALLAGIAALLLGPRPAAAATPEQVQTCRALAVAQALAVPPATKAEVAAIRRTCLFAAKVRACLRVRGSNMGSGLCVAIVHVRPDWSTNAAYHELLRRESTWSTNAVNESSGACGAFQRLPCPWRYHGGTRSPHDDRVYSSPLEQTRNGVRYIVGRYGSPEAAIRFHNRIGWY